MNKMPKKKSHTVRRLLSYVGRGYLIRFFLVLVCILVSAVASVAGSIFLGRNCPEALGDYFAGPNHTLPTMGTARFYSPLSVDDFVKKSQFSYYTRDALARDYRKVSLFARKEGLPLTYLEGEGQHDIPFWDGMLEPAFRFMTESH